MYTITIIALRNEVLIQDPFPADGRFVINLQALDNIYPITGVYEVSDAQFDRIKPQLDAHVSIGTITYTYLDGPASIVVNDSSVAGVTVRDALDNIVAGATLDVFAVSGGREGATISNVYLRGPGAVPMNQAGYVIPFNATIVGISMATTGVETWTLEVRKNNGASPILTLVCTAQDKEYDDSSAVDVDAGDEIQLYCNGTNIGAPSGTVILRGR